MKILVFDSGLGGVPVLARLKRFCPHADYVYASDPVHMPYGERDGDEVTRLVRDRIASVESDLIVLACNTATALAATALRAEFRTRIYGIEPAIKPARMLAHGRITVLSTRDGSCACGGVDGRARDRLSHACDADRAGSVGEQSRPSRRGGSGAGDGILYSGARTILFLRACVAGIPCL